MNETAAHGAMPEARADALLQMVRAWPFLGDHGRLGVWWRDPRWEFRRLAPLALAWLRPTALLRLAPQMMRDPEPRVRATVAEAVGTAAFLADRALDTPEVSWPLAQAHREGEALVRQAAGAAIDLLS